MKFLKLKSSIFLLFILVSRNTYACTVTPAFTISTAHTCGLPHIVTVNNFSSGTNNGVVKYWWKLNYQMASDTIVGKGTYKILLKKTGSNRIRLFVRDSSGCVDSSAAATVNVSSGAKGILDQSLNYTTSPVWMNCLQFITDPDTFRVNIESADTLKSLKIFWGDGTKDTAGTDLNPNTKKTHLFNALGIFTIKIVTTNGSCIDTVYGMVYNQRQPTAGIVGPPSGSNRGCVPHQLRIINNSYNISNNTTFYIDWGNGDMETAPYTAYKDTMYHTYKTGICSGVIKITASNVCGSSFTTWNPIDISEKDKALWAVTTTCNPTQNHLFQNLSSDKYCLTPDIKEYFWDFGDGTTVGWIGKADQYHKYAKEGDYDVMLIAKSACGNDTFISRVAVYYNPTAAFAYSSDRGCKPLSVQVTDTSKGRGYTRLWTVTEGSNTFTSTDSILTYNFTSPGTHSISLRVTNPCGSSTLSRNFKVNDKPTATFANISSTCVPVTVNFTNNSSSWFNNPTFSWDFGDSTFSNQKDPSAKVYNTPGNYTVRLIVSDSCGNDTFTQTFTAYGLPQAILSGDTTSCTFDSMQFNNQSINSTTYDWDFGDMQTLTTTYTGITKHVYTSTGNHTIRLIAGSGAGCKDTAYYSIFIKPGAKALFDVDKNFACSPATFKFTNKSLLAQDYRWYANGQLISTMSNLSDTTINSDSTVLRLKLIATSASSCQGDSVEHVFFTAKNPKAIIGNLDSGCGLTTVTFNNQSTDAISFYWNLGNGSSSTQKNPTSVYPALSQKDTAYIPELKVSSWAGCRDSVKSIVKVFPGPQAAFTTSSNQGCGPLQVNFTNISKTNNGNGFNTLSHRWYFGDTAQSTQTDPGHLFLANTVKDTVYQVSLKVSTINGCTDSVSSFIRVFPQPYVAFSPDRSSGCALLPVTFTNLSSPRDTGSIQIMSFNWSSGNGSSATSRNFSAVYGASAYADTVYQVKLVGRSEHGCTDSNIVNITVHPQPQALFTLDKISGCTPLQVATNNQSVSKDGGALTHHWNFGNSFQSTYRNDSTTFINSGNSDLNFTVTYQAISQYNCRDTATQQITVRPKPIASFTKSTQKACAPMVLELTDNSVNAANYYWGEGLNHKTGGITETMLLQGLPLFDSLYVIAHQVSSVYGCLSDTVYQQVIVLGRPEANFEFSADSVCARQNIHLINTSLGGYQYTWNFGDNTGSNQINPKHKFPVLPNNGRDSSYQVSLEVRSSAGCKDTIQKDILLVNRPLDPMVLDKQIGCTDLNVSFKHQSTAFKTVYWDFGDRSPFETADSVNHTFVNLLGNMTMQPKISLYRQRYNCRDTASTTVMVYPKPTADFKATRFDPCDLGNYQFINKSKNNSSNEWTINETTIISASSFNTVLPASKEKDTFYSVKLYVKNAYNCIDSVMQVVKVKPKMQIKFDKNSLTACEKGVVQFTNNSSSAVRYFWKFGDGGLSNEVHPSYVYNHYGIYKVMLFGYDADGCVDSSDGKTFFQVYEKPKADFSYLPALPKLPNAVVNFTAKPTIYSMNEDDLIYEWNFGDATFPTGNKNVKHPTHQYYTPGNKEVTLTIWNQNCSDVVKKPLFVEDPKPELDFSADTVEGCAALRIQFKNNTKYAQTYRWIFGDGTPDSYEKEPVHVYKYAGSWDVTLIATGTGGTTSETKQYMIKVLPKPDAEFFTSKKYMNLPNATFAMQNVSNNAIKYNWYVYDSFNNVIDGSTLRDPSFVINEQGQFSIKLIAYNSYGCSDTMYKPSYIATFKEGYVYTPSAFSPNKNGRNDGFKPSTYNVKDENYVFRVFNRWGEKMFETFDQNEEWDGTHNGELCAQDVYMWTVNGEYTNSDLFAFRGTLTLLR